MPIIVNTIKMYIFDDINIPPDASYSRLPDESLESLAVFRRQIPQLTQMYRTS